MAGAPAENLIDLADAAYDLARRLEQEVLRLRRADTSQTLTRMSYSLGICAGDAQTAANRLAGLRQEVRELASLTRIAA